MNEQRVVRSLIRAPRVRSPLEQVMLCIIDQTPGGAKSFSEAELREEIIAEVAAQVASRNLSLQAGISALATLNTDDWIEIWDNCRKEKALARQPARLLRD